MVYRGFEHKIYTKKLTQLNRPEPRNQNGQT